MPNPLLCISKKFFFPSNEGSGPAFKNYCCICYFFSPPKNPSAIEPHTPPPPVSQGSVSHHIWFRFCHKANMLTAKILMRTNLCIVPSPLPRGYTRPLCHVIPFVKRQVNWRPIKTRIGRLCTPALGGGKHTSGSRSTPVFSLWWRLTNTSRNASGIWPLVVITLLMGKIISVRWTC